MGCEPVWEEMHQLVRARLARVARASYRYVWRRVPYLLTLDVRGPPVSREISGERG